MNLIIKDFQNKIRQSATKTEQQKVASELHDYIATLPENDQKRYFQELKMSISRKMEVIDKLVESYELLKEDSLQLM